MEIFRLLLLVSVDEHRKTFRAKSKDKELFNEI
jgi:hypothetical protein